MLGAYSLPSNFYLNTSLLLNFKIKFIFNNYKLLLITVSGYWSQYLKKKVKKNKTKQL
jgi:hypothetical protein